MPEAKKIDECIQLNHRINIGLKNIEWSFTYTGSFFVISEFACSVLWLQPGNKEEQEQLQQGLQAGRDQGCLHHLLHLVGGQVLEERKGGRGELQRAHLHPQGAAAMLGAY